MLKPINYNVRLRTVTLAEMAALVHHFNSHFEKEERTDGVVRFQCSGCNNFLHGDFSLEGALAHAAKHHKENCDECRDLKFPAIRQA